MLKLYMNESNEFLYEDIDAIKKYYPNISDDMFLTLIELDPTYRQGSNSAGKYGKWILNLYNRGTISENDFNDVTNLLNQFNIYKNRIQNKDLNSYKTLDALADTLGAVIDDDSMLTDRQKLRFLKNVKSGKVSTSAENDYDVVLDTPKFIVYVPNTHEASMKLGKGTKWCTAHENPDWYEEYTRDGSRLYIVKDKETGERWQYSDLDDPYLEDNFLDQFDRQFDITELLMKDRKLANFFSNFGFEIPTELIKLAEDGFYTYDGQEISYRLKSYITKIVISNNITNIDECAFANCTSLVSVVIPNTVTNIGHSAFRGCIHLKSIAIPNSVISIGVSAFEDCYDLVDVQLSNKLKEISKGTFWNCRSLKSIIIPNTIEEINNDAFYDCKSLESIKLPNNVTKIGNGVFYDCTSLKSIIIPDSVTEIGTYVFDDCPNLTVYTNNKYVIDYCNDNGIPVKPLNNNESYKKAYKLHIREN